MTTKIIICLVFMTSLCAKSFGQFWRTDAMIDIVADSIEYTILKNKGRTIRVIERQNGFKHKYIVTWLNDSICKIKVHARNSTFVNETGTYTVEYMICRNNELCVYNFKVKKVKYCYQDNKKYPESKDYIATTCLSFDWNKKKEYQTHL